MLHAISAGMCRWLSQKTMKKIYNILLAIAAIAMIAVLGSQPFGEYTSMQITFNSAIILVALPAWVAGFIKNNPELTK